MGLLSRGLSRGPVPPQTSLWISAGHLELACSLRRCLSNCVPREEVEACRPIYVYICCATTEHFIALMHKLSLSIPPPFSLVSCSAYFFRP
jgi:hypothetical protein